MSADYTPVLAANPSTEPGMRNVLTIARRLATRLDEAELPYGIGGTLALKAYGAVGAATNISITIFVSEAELPRVFDALERAGIMVDRANAVRDVPRIGLFKAYAGRTVVDVFMTSHPQYEAMKQRRAQIDDTAGAELSFISAEDLCIHKLIYGRAKDVTDLERLIAVRPTIDLAYVRGWLEKMLPAGDRRFALLDDLERRFSEP